MTREADYWWLPDHAVADRGTFEAWCARDRTVPVPGEEEQGLWCKVLGGPIRMRLATEDDSLTPSLQQYGYWESWISVAIARALRPGMLAVDVGANLGYYTLLMGARTLRPVVAFEPQQALVRILEQTLLQNRDTVPFADVRAFALGGRTGFRVLQHYGRLLGSASFDVAAGWTPTSQEQVWCQRLDDQGLRRVDFLKVDAEGAEAEIWDGSERLRRENRRMIITMEVGTNRSYHLGTFLHHIESQGYDLAYVDEGGVIQQGAPPMPEADSLGMLWLQQRVTVPQPYAVPVRTSVLQPA